MNEWEKTIHTNEFKNNDQVLAKANNAEVLLIKSNDEYFAVTYKLCSSWPRVEGWQGEF